MIREKKHGFIWYALAGVVAAIVIWALMFEVKAPLEQVEESIENPL